MEYETCKVNIYYVNGKMFYSGRIASKLIFSGQAKENDSLSFENFLCESWKNRGKIELMTEVPNELEEIGEKSDFIAMKESVKRLNERGLYVSIARNS